LELINRERIETRERTSNVYLNETHRRPLKAKKRKIGKKKKKEKMK
jgi:hypothetical protein